MGHHYVPQYYLQGFSTPSDSSLIWMYQKGQRDAVCVSIKQVAQRKAFYTELTERYLAEQIEGPANAILARVRGRQPIAPDEKQTLARYMEAMLKRVPRYRDRLEKTAPGVLASIFVDLNEFIADAIARAPSEAAQWEEIRAQAQQLRTSYEEQIPDDVWQGIVQPKLSLRIVQALLGMTWVFYARDHPPYFLTSDNPVFYFEHRGIGNPESEISFPVASDIALWGTRRPDIRECTVQADTQLVKEFNRRTISAATRFVFHRFREDWIITSVNKSRHRLNRIWPGGA